MNEAWTDWQREHAAALAALQDAQRAYHRAAVATAVGSQPSAVDSQQSAVDSREAALEALETARVTLDEVRARMPR